MKITRSQEDYLKLIWHLEQNNQKASIQHVARMHQVKPPTVLAMFQQLKKQELLEYSKSIGAKLSAKGDHLVRKLVRKHRLIETFLQQVLDMDEQTLHDEAERLEHVISDQLMYRIDRFLGYPQKDPHGSQIPSWDGEEKPVLLTKVSVGKTFRIYTLSLNVKMSDFYRQRALKANSIWTLREQAPDKSSFLLSDGQNYLALSQQVAGKIKVVVL